MRIKQRYCFRVNAKTKRIYKFLVDNKIKHKEPKGCGAKYVVLEIFENDENWKKIKRMLKRLKCTPITECVYSKEECDNAAWLSVRSKFRWEYPQPEGNMEYKSITYNDETFCDSCGCGLIQNDVFRVKREPKWGERHFLMLFWIEDELFISNKAAEILEKSTLKGFEILEVNYAKKNIPIDNIKQIRVTKHLNPSMIIEKSNIKQKIKCKKCGCVKYILKGRELYCQEDAFQELDVDIIKSGEVLGGGHICSRRIFISNDFYRLLVDNGLSKDLIFKLAFL